MIDLIQKYGGRKYKKPHIRVWCHPHYINKSGDDYYYEFKNIKDASEFIKTHNESEEIPLIAYNGYELRIADFRKKYPKIRI